MSMVKKVMREEQVRKEGGGKKRRQNIEDRKLKIENGR